MFKKIFWLAWFSGALMFADMKSPDSIVTCVFWASITALVIGLALKAKELAVAALDDNAEEAQPKRATREDVR